VSLEFEETRLIQDVGLFIIKIILKLT
jgi:hypothetical protein